MGREAQQLGNIAMSAKPDGHLHIEELPEVPQLTHAPVPPSPSSPDRLGLLWRAKWVVLVVTALIAALTYGISSAMPAKYESSIVVRIAAQGGDNSASNLAVQASNDLASQYAQLVTAAPPIMEAASKLHIGSGTLAASVSASTVAAQNLVKITAQAPSPEGASTRARQVAQAFRVYVGHLTRRQGNDYANAVSARLKPLDDNIAQTRRQLQTGTASERLESLKILSNLLIQRQEFEASVAKSAASAQPTVQVLFSPSAGAKVSPKPKLYALIALIAGLILVSQIAITVLSRRPVLTA
jgi:capsular polysaccharide biosynthesis protein